MSKCSKKINDKTVALIPFRVVIGGKRGEKIENRNYS
jgi:hypothetical protein